MRERVILKLILAALTDLRVQALLLGIVERVIGKANADQLALLRAELTQQTKHIEHRIDELEDRINMRLDDHDRRIAALEDDLPGPPPALPDVHPAPKPSKKP